MLPVLRSRVPVALRRTGLRVCASPASAYVRGLSTSAAAWASVPPSAEPTAGQQSAGAQGPQGPQATPGAAPGAPTAKPQRGLKISHLFGGLVGCGLLVTIYGLLEWYYSLQIWPEPVKTPLKAAIKAKARGDVERADAYFRAALEAARSIPPSALDPDPLLKLSGIYISLGAMLEDAGQPVRAFQDMRDAYALFGAAPLTSPPGEVTGWAASEGPHELTHDEVTRAIGLAQKLGQIAATLGGMNVPPAFPQNEDASPDAPQETWDSAAEKYLSSALAAMLRLGLAGRSPTSGPVVAGRDVTLPHDNPEDDTPRVNKRGLGLTMEALAEVYGRQRRPDLAAQLLLQAITILIPPQAENPPVADRCQAAMLMTSISTHALEPRTPAAISAARSWSLKALQLVDGAAKEEGWTGAPADIASAACARARSVALFNLGMLAEIDKDNAAAARHFDAALRASREAGFGEGRREAARALKRVQGALGSEA